jgi:DNA gyrase subunit A
VLTEKGNGKRTPLDEYVPKGRGTLGVATINPRALAQIGQVSQARVVQEGDEVTLISAAGIVLRTKVASIPVQGRATQGVKVMVLDEGDSIAAVARIPAEKPIAPQLNEEPSESSPA